MFHESAFCQAKPKFDEIAREFHTNESKKSKNSRLSSIDSILEIFHLVLTQFILKFSGVS